MKIGVLKEPQGENRVAFLPEGVTELINQKVDVSVEKGAGKRAFVTDEDYKNVGAEITDAKSIFSDCEIVIRISAFTSDEVKKFKPGQVVLSVLNPLTNHSLVQELAEANITSFSLDTIPRITRAQTMDILSSMATIAGYKAVLEAASYLPTFFPMFMSAAGTIRPAKVLILGAGVAGLQAIATSRKLGAVVEVFDVRSAVKEEVMSLGGKFIEVEGAREDDAAGGYAVEQTEEFKQKQGQLIQDHAMKSNVVICTAQIPGKKAPVLIKKETVENMKPGSVIIDLAASTGGNCEVTKNNEVVEINQVRVIGKSDYPSEMPMDASRMFGKNLNNFLKLIIGEEGELNLNFEDEIVKGTCITNNKEIVNERVKQIIES
ncbi:MAG: Re/Si-specific NAD(P)(+) transhydrogenase subunit alpha [Bacteroidota bacterium]